jgi:hypothetical protein
MPDLLGYRPFATAGPLVELVFGEMNCQRLDPLRRCCQNVEQISITQQQQQLTLVVEGAVRRVRVDDTLVHFVHQ